MMLAFAALDVLDRFTEDNLYPVDKRAFGQFDIGKITQLCKKIFYGHIRRHQKIYIS